ncbi:MAG TPA: SEC-C domain-containing protein [Ktedonobacteraceae bacterium]|nr:SEC-C domain-containing protein [Ktedonobacteraceae bacterium]
MRGLLYQRAHMQTKPKSWYELDGGERLAQERERIAVAFPGLLYRIDELAKRVFLEGTITLVAECGIPTTIQLRVEFPNGYPEYEPRVYDAGQRFPHVADRHFYPDGQCCLWLPPESRWNGKDPDGLCLLLEEVAVFLDQQLTYEAMGKGQWPGRQRSHRDAGYIEFILELLGSDQRLLEALAPTLANRSGVERNASCPCGSGIKYKRCHLRVVEEIGRRVGWIRLYAIFDRWCKEHEVLT